MSGWRFIPTSIAALFASALICSGYAVAQQPQWTGAYAGGVIGYGWDDINISANIPGQLTSFQDFEAVFGGVQGGVNFFRQGNFVAGIVADIIWIDDGSRGAFSQSSTSLIDEEVEITTITDLDVDFELLWKASIRSKAGILAAPNLFLYTTTGIAFAKLDAQSAQTTSVTIAQQQPLVSTTTASNDMIIYGAVFGAGVETLVTPNVGAFVQVLHYVFDEESVGLLGSRFDVDLDETVIAAGINFYFN